MTEESVQNGNEHTENGNGSTFTEAPASFNVRALSPAGYDCQLTIRDTDTAALIKRALRALHWLADNDFRPKGQYIAPSGGNGGQDWPSAENVKVCSVHQVAMTRREKNGELWHSHKAIHSDGAEYWCRGKGK